MSALTRILSDMEQGSNAWLSLRTTKITSTDACVIMGASHWKTKIQLYNEKIHESVSAFVNERMKRGIELEPIARELFSIQNNIEMYPRIVIKDWAMASLDGMSECNQHIVEIKCPGEKDHALALQGKVPDHYYPQLQHQLYVTGLDSIFYYSFDGTDGVTLKIERDEEYIEKMVIEEKKFYDCIVNKTPPEVTESDYVEREDDLWQQCASQWQSLSQQIKDLERQEEEMRNHLIFLSGESNSKGAGISLLKVQKKGNVEYTKIPELRGVDLEKYRKSGSTYWRINAQ